MAANKNIVVIVFDVGPNGAERESENGPTFFDEAKKCIEKIILRKLFTKPKDEIALLLFGTETTDNDLNEEVDGHYEHISKGFPMEPVNWNMIRYVKSIDSPSHGVIVDWLDGIMVAMDYLKLRGHSKSNMKIILLTTFSTSVLECNMQTVVSDLKASKIELMAISSNIEYLRNENEQLEHAVSSQTIVKDDVRQKSESILIELIKRCDGILCSFNEAIPQLMYFDKLQTRRVPWNCDLEIGKDLKIKIAAYIYIREEMHTGKWKVKIKRPVEEEIENEVMERVGNDIETETQINIEDELMNGVANVNECKSEIGKGNDSKNVDEIENENAEPVKSITEYSYNDSTVIQRPEYIKGYKYGGEFVPYDDTVSPNNDARKSLLCIHFTATKFISDLHLAGTGIWVIVPQKKCPASSKMLTALAMAMRKTDVAMIARYSYSAKTPPKMMVLFPNDLNKKHPEHNSLLMYELFYAQNHVKIQFPSFFTKKNEPSPEQYEAIDNLIDSMDLDSCQTFNRLHDPSLQHLYRAIENRALNPQNPPIGIEEDIMDMLYTPRHLQQQFQPFIATVQELFDFKKVKKSMKNALSAKLQENSSNVKCATDDVGVGDVTLKITKIRSATPADDFTELLNRGEQIHTLATQMQEVIHIITFQSVEILEEKISLALKVYRDAAKTKGPFRYNKWIEEFKTKLLERDKVDVWQKIIVAECYGLITAEESEISTVTDSEAEKFYRITDKHGNNSSAAVGDDANIDNLFDDM